MPRCCRTAQHQSWAARLQAASRDHRESVLSSHRRAVKEAEALIAEAQQQMTSLSDQYSSIKESLEIFKLQHEQARQLLKTVENSLGHGV